jgi:peptidoglycan/LPS O-acetylase OafA/YrhL
MDDRPFWFPAKRYGWGWGLPVRWQGWAVLAGYFALVFGAIAYFEPRHVPPLRLLVYLTLLTAVLIAIVALKGERPLRWRWRRK